MHARCNANSQDDRGATALHYAAASGSFECSRILAVDAQADCSIGTVGGTTAVMYASVEGMVDCLKLLVKQPTANVNQQSKDGRSALHFACQNNGHFLAARVSLFSFSVNTLHVLAMTIQMGKTTINT